MINRNKNRIKISSTNDFNVKSYSDSIGHLSLLLKLSTAKLSRTIFWNHILHPVVRVPSKQVSLFYAEKQIFIQHVLLCSNKSF